MNRDSLLLFMQRILENGSAEKSRFSLGQLKKILETQGAERDLIDLVQDTLSSVPEAKALAAKEELSEESLKIMIMREKERRRRAEAMERMGRC